MAQAKRILVVDDREAVRTVLVEVLHWLGYEVEAVGSGEEAMVVFDEVRHVCLLTDHCMPGMSGTELIRLLRRRCPTLPVVAVTAAEADEELLAAGALEIIKKPFDIGQIQEAVERVLEAANG